MSRWLSDITLPDWFFEWLPVFQVAALAVLVLVHLVAEAVRGMFRRRRVANV